MVTSETWIRKYRTLCDQHGRRLVLSIAGLVLFGFIMSPARAAVGCINASAGKPSVAHDLSVEALGELIAFHRLCWPAYEVAYTHDLFANIDRTAIPGASREETIWFYANASPGFPRATVRSIAETPAPAGIDDRKLDRVTWMFNSETETSTFVDLAGGIARVSQTHRALKGNHEYESFTGTAAMQSLSADSPSAFDLVTAIRAGAAVLRPDLVDIGGHQCRVVDVSAEPGGGLADRHTFYVCESLNHAVVALDVVAADELWSRRVGSDFFEIAPGAPLLPLIGSLWCRGDGTSEIQQEIRVLRATDGTPQIRVGDAVDFTLRLEPGTRIEDLDTGALRVVASDWGDQTFAALGLPSVGADFPPGFTIAILGCASLAALGLATWKRQRRCAPREHLTSVQR